MGAYLSAPSVEKRSADFTKSDKLSYGVSGMQGWRISMEDAHNCVPDLTENTSLFGVFDGHGGSEVAQYCALHFADVLKELEGYKTGNYEDALKEAFMKIDKVLLEQQTIRELKILADQDPDSGPLTEEEMKAVEARQQDEEECEENEMELLHEEATMSIEELLARYGKAANETKSQIKAQKAKVKNEETSEASCGSSSSSTKIRGIEKEEPSSADSEGGVSSSTDPESEQVASSGEGNSSNDEPSSTSDMKVEDSGTNSGLKVEASSSEVTSSTSDLKVTEDGTPQQSMTPGGSNEDAVSSSSSSQGKPKTDDLSTVNSENDNLSSGEPATSVNTVGSSDSSGAKVKSSGKIQPKIKAVKLGPSDEDFDPGSGSESEEESDGFDSDEAVGGSSESEEDDDEEEEEEEDEEDMDAVKIPSLGAIAAASEEPGKDSGTTAVIALINNYKLYVANAGDSRCVLCRSGVAFDMSDDHKPEDDSEIKRIKAAGGHVNMQGRVNGGLNLSRAIGDHCYKTNASLDLENQMISAMPDIRQVTLSSGDNFMVLACDGIWNVLSSQDVVNFVLARLPQPESKNDVKLSAICEELMDACLAPDTTGDGTGCDNMTCVIVKFNEEWLKDSTPNSAVEDTKAAEISHTDSDVTNSNVTEGKLNGSLSDEKKNSSVKRARTENELDGDSKRQKVEA